MPGLPPRGPTKRDLKSAMLWCARHMLGEDGQPYLGKRLSVCVSAEGEGEAIEVKPVKGTDGVEPPDLIRPPLVAFDGADVPAAELLRVLFSADELSILRGLAGHEPSKANDVLDRCRGAVEKSRFWVLWANLQHRNVIGDAEVGEGFVILPAWVREMCGAEGKGRAA